MIILDNLELTLSEDLDFSDRAMFSETYDDEIRLNIKGDARWFSRLKFVRILLNDQVIYQDKPQEIEVAIPYPKSDSVMQLRVVSYCPTCAKKTMQQLQNGVDLS